MPTLSPRFPGLPCRRFHTTLAGVASQVDAQCRLGWLRRRCICAPTPAASAVTWPNSPTRRWRAGSTSSSCATRARWASSSSGRWRPARSSPRSRCSPTRRAGTTRYSPSTTGPTSLGGGADVLHLGQDDLPLADRARHHRGRAADRPLHPRPRPGRRRRSPRPVDYFCVGPCWPTPTKPGRPAPGLDAGPRGSRHRRRSGRQAVVRDRRHRRAAAARGARRGCAPRRGGAGDHRRRRSAGSGRAADGSQLGG